MTTRIAGGLLWGYNPEEERAASQGAALRLALRSEMPLPPWRAAGCGYLAKGSSYSLTLSLSSAMSWASCSLMYLAIVASFSPTVDT